MWPQESPVSIRVVRGLPGFLYSHCWGRSPHLELRPEHQVSSPVPTWISGFLWGFRREVRPRLARDMQIHSLLELGKQCQASCRVHIGIGGFLSRCHRAVTRPSCCESILSVTVESVQRNQVYLAWNGTSGPFGMVVRFLDFLSTFKLKPPPLEVRRVCRDSFPDEAGTGTLISR